MILIETNIMRTYCRKILHVFFLHQKYNDVSQIETRSLMLVIINLIGNDQNREQGIFVLMFSCLMINYFHVQYINIHAYIQTQKHNNTYDLLFCTANDVILFFFCYHHDLIDLIVGKCWLRSSYCMYHPRSKHVTLMICQ